MRENSVIYAYATNLSGMFEHLNELNDRRENNPDWGHAYDTRNSIGGSRPNIELDRISENIEYFLYSEMILQMRRK